MASLNVYSFEQGRAGFEGPLFQQRQNALIRDQGTIRGFDNKLAFVFFQALGYPVSRCLCLCQLLEVSIKLRNYRNLINGRSKN